MESLVSVSKTTHKTTIHVEGVFGFDLYSHITNIIDDCQEKAENNSRRCFVIDMANVTAINPSALGVLLILWERIYPIHNPECGISIINTAPKIRQILEEANLQELFEIN